MTTSMRKLMEAATYTGPIDSEHVKYSEEIKGKTNKVIATLSHSKSAEYTKLGRDLVKITELTEQVDKLKEEVKLHSKEKIQDLFNADDAMRTRVVETVGFTFQMTKDIESTTTFKYKEILDEIQEHLTPELVQMLESIKSKYMTVKSGSVGRLTAVQDKNVTPPEPASESVMHEGVMDNLKAYFKKFANYVASWGQKYDKKLNVLKQAAATLGESVIDEAAEPNMYAEKVKKLCSIYQGKMTPEAFDNAMLFDDMNKVDENTRVDIEYTNSTRGSKTKHFDDAYAAQHFAFKVALASGEIDSVDISHQTTETIMPTTEAYPEEEGIDADSVADFLAYSIQKDKLIALKTDAVITGDSTNAQFGVKDVDSGNTYTVSVVKKGKNESMVSEGPVEGLSEEALELCNAVFLTAKQEGFAFEKANQNPDQWLSQAKKVQARSQDAMDALHAYILKLEQAAKGGM